MDLRRPFLAALAAIAVLGFVAPAGADPITFGARTVEIPPPAGLVPIGAEFPALVDNTQAYLPASNRLVEMYVPADAREGLRAGTQGTLPRSMQLQVMREMEGVRLPAGEFEGGIGAMEKGIAEAVAQMQESPDDLAAQGNARTDKALAFGGVQMLGVTRREPWGLFFTSSMQAADTTQADAKPVRIYIGNAIVLVDEQLVLLSSYAHESVPEARAEVERSVSTWADAIQAAHGLAPAVAAAVPAAAAPAATEATADSKKGGLPLALIIGLGVVLLVVVAVVLKGRKS